MKRSYAPVTDRRGNKHKIRLNSGRLIKIPSLMKPKNKGSPLFV